MLISEDGTSSSNEPETVIGFSTIFHKKRGKKRGLSFLLHLADWI
jgi:hypothetical protein